MKLIDDVRAAYNSRTKIGCTGCRYCMPCPNGVSIPEVFRLWNESSLYGTDPKKSNEYKRLVENSATPENCIECGACEAACPQYLPIIQSLKDAWADMNR